MKYSLLLIPTCLLCIPSALSYFQFIDEIKQNFEHSFHQKCDKYPFVDQWVKKLENPQQDHHIIFIWQEPGLRNGGLGDRIAGLLNAITSSLRFGRQLLVRDYSGLYKLFRPYHPYDIWNPNPKYTWDRGEDWQGWNWSSYENKWCCNDEHEFDNWNCNNVDGRQNGQCSMINGDVGQPHILQRGNRAYFCSIENNPGSPAYRDFRDKLGIPEDSDMFEVAGCMLRLALWPTPQLWDEVEALYQDFDRTIPRPENNHHHEHHLHSHSSGKRQRRLTKAFLGANTTVKTAHTEGDFQPSELVEHKSLRGAMGQDKDRQVKSKSKIDTGTETGSYSNVDSLVDGVATDKTTETSEHQKHEKQSIERDWTAESISNQTDTPDQYVARRAQEDHVRWHSVHHSVKYFQVGLHFRCGDKSFLAKDAADNQCIWHPEIEDPTYIHDMKPGNPVGIANCGYKVFANLSVALQHAFDDQGSMDRSDRKLRERAESSISQEKNLELPSRDKYPPHWGAPPIRQTRDLVPLPANYGMGSSTVAKWITININNDLRREQKSRILEMLDSDANLPDFTVDPPFPPVDPSTILLTESDEAALSSATTTSATDTDTDATTTGNAASGTVPIANGVGLEHPASHLVNSMLVVMSDNDKAVEQMSDVVGHPYTLLGPQGCHVELDQSDECQVFTVSYWFMLAMSDVIVTQKGPTSAFSRYAAVYGLKDNPIRNGATIDGDMCDMEWDTKIMGRTPMGNWFC